MGSLPQPGPQRAALYARSATEGQGMPRAVDRQLDALRDYCCANGLTIAGEYVDAAVSGLTPLAKRPAGRALLADAEARRFDLLIVDDADRLGREAADVAAAVMALRQHGVAVRAATNPGALSDEALTALSEAQGLVREIPRRGNGSAGLSR